jgi:MFS superfamily sulfate permease-like transporter
MTDYRDRQPRSQMPSASEASQVPRGTIDGLRRYWKFDLLSGFLVFLLALPLCLGIALASGFPAIAGIFSAIIGGMLTPFFSNSELTIKGPAAGLIVILLGCVMDFGFTGGRDLVADIQAYQLALGVGVAAGIIQILLGVFRAGRLGEFFPTAAIHGLLASIGVIIIAKQFPVTLGLGSEGAPLELLAKIPQFIMGMNPIVALIGILSLAIMFGYPLIKSPRLKVIPAPLVVLLIAVPLGMYFDIGQDNTYSFGGHEHSLGAQFLVNVPENMFGAVTFPAFSGLSTFTAWQWVLMFALIGSLESLLSAKAIDEIDPWRRKTNHDRDLVAVGVGNTLSSFVGGLPMISEIVRSRANIDSGARTRFSNVFHGTFLLIFVAALPAWINQIPLAALAAMLVRVGFRLASPQEFIHMYKIGREQFVIFVSTIVAVLATDLLLGIAIGIGIYLAFHIFHGVPFRSLFRLQADVEQAENDGVVIVVKESAVFSTWIGLKKKLEQSRRENRVVLDLSQTYFVDHTVMVRLAEMQIQFNETNSVLVITGLDQHRKLSNSPNAARKKARIK